MMDDYNDHYQHSKIRRSESQLVCLPQNPRKRNYLDLEEKTVEENLTLSYYKTTTES